MKKKHHRIFRDAETGRIVTEEYAKENPSTTVSEAVETGSDNKTPSRNTEDEQGETADSVAE